MSCGCKKNAVNDKRPDTPCVFCAHKHITAARALYQLELGYRDVNKSDAIGQLILAAWHYDRQHHELAMQCRAIWLDMERFKDVSSALNSLQQRAWELVCATQSE